MWSTRTIIMIGCVIVGGATVVSLSIIHSPTNLNVIIGMLSWFAVDSMMEVSTQNSSWSVAGLLSVGMGVIMSVALFFLPSLAIVGLARIRFSERTTFLFVSGWLGFYLSALFVLFVTSSFP